MWEIYAYHNSEALAGIFNALAAITSAQGYLGSVAAVAVCGFFAAMVAYMFAPDKLQGWKWLGSVVLIYGVMILPRATVGVVDKTGGSAVRVIQNVPFGAAALGGLTSSIGNTLTQLFETAFQVIPGNGSLPAELAYQQNGMMFGSRLIQESRRVAFSDPYLRADLLNFVENCTVYDLEDRSITPADFNKSADLWAAMRTTNPARFSTVSDDTGVTTKPCDEAYVMLDMRMPAQVNGLAQKLSGKLYPSLSSVAAQNALLNAIPQAYIVTQMQAASLGATGLLRQNALINAINDASEMRCQRINDPSCMMMATGRANAVAAQNAAWINGAKISEQALPIVRNAAEALTYAVFPIIVLLLFLTSGRGTITVLSGYLAVLVSIQLWPPLFAVLSYMGSIYAQFDQAAAVDIGGGLKVLSLETANGVYGNSISAQAVVSYLIIAIPPLSYALANRLVSFGSTLTGGLFGLQSTIGNTSSAAAAGNVSLGNMTLDQRMVSPMASNPFVSRTQDIQGNWLTRDGTGRTAVSFLRNEGIASVEASAKVTASHVEMANKAVSAAKGELVSSASSTASILSDVYSRATSTSRGTRNSAGQTVSASEEMTAALETMKGDVSRASKATNVGEDQTANALFRLAVTPGLLGAIGSKVAGVRMGAQMEKNYAFKLNEVESKVLDAVDSDTLKRVKSFADRVSRDTSFLNSISTDSTSGSSFSSALNRSKTRLDSAEARFNEVVTRAEEFRNAHELGLGGTYSVTADPVNSYMLYELNEAARRYHGNPQAMAAHLASGLGNISATPSRWSDGTAVPASTADVRQLHGANAGTVRGDHGRHDGPGRGSSGGSGRPSRPGSPSSRPSASTDTDTALLPGAIAPPKELEDSSRFREGVNSGGDKDLANRQPKDFDKDHGIVRDKNGRPSMQGSMVGRTGEMVVRDASGVVKGMVSDVQRQIEEEKQRKGPR